MVARGNRSRMRWVAAAAGTLALSVAGVALAARPEASATEGPLIPSQSLHQGAEEGVEVPPPPFSPGIFPCSNCHSSMPANPTRRALTFHTEIELRHDEENRWCLDCHDAVNRDSLHLAGGEQVSFEESYRLCGQCHGEKYRDWRAGVHGRRSGEWDGHKTYLLCAHCHNPHRPRFQPIEPEPAPIPPAETVGGRGR